ncbi:MAG: hypothetical protein ACL7BU_04770 [Candidatus Phlomobacter fragariae]
MQDIANKRMEEHHFYVLSMEHLISGIFSYVGDSIRDIKGTFVVWGGWDSSGSFTTGEKLSSVLSAGRFINDYKCYFKASDTVPTGDENKPLDIGVTLAIYLGV